MPTINRRAPFRRVRRARWVPSVLAAINGAATITLADATSSAAGTVAVVGAAAPTLAGVTVSAAGTVAITGTGAATLADVTLAGVGTVGSGITGDAAITFDAVTVSSAGAVAVTGASAPTLADVTVSAAGTSALTGAAAITLDAVTTSAAGAVAVRGAAAITLGATTLVGIGSGPTTNYEISVGSGYTDVSPKQLVRTSGNVLYIAASNCDSYPCDASTQTLRMYKADSTGIPSGFTRKDSAGEVSGVAQWAIAIDGDDLIHVVYTQRTTTAGNITAFRYVTYDTSTDTWGTPEAIDTGTFSYSSGQGDQSCAMALDSNGVPHAVYLKTDGTQRNIYYRNRVGGTWSSAELVNDQSFGSNDKVWHPNIIFDADGRRVFAWLIGTFNDVADGTIFTRVRQTNGTWDSTVNMSGNNQALTSIDQSTSMMATSDGTYHITWIDASTTPGNKYINYAYSTDHGATWTQNNPGSGTQATHNPSLGPNGAGGIRIWGHGTPDSGNHGDNLYYFDGDGGAAAWGSWTLAVTSTQYDCSINTRWSQYFHAKDGIVDIAYWDQDYPNNLYAGTAIITPDSIGTAAITLDAVTSSAAGGVTIVGTAAATLAAVTTAAAGGVAIVGTAAATLAAITLSGTGQALIRGASAPTLADIGGSSAGIVGIAGAAAITLADLALVAAGTVATVGAAAITLDAVTLAATGRGPITITGVVHITVTARAPSLTVAARAPSITVTSSTD